MAVTYEPIATTTVSGFASTIDFTSISGTYTDLRLVFYMKMITTNSSIFLRVNGDTGANYSSNGYSVDIATAGVSVISSISNTQCFVGNGRNANWQYYTVDLMSYANTSIYKPMLSSSYVDLNGSGTANKIMSRWTNTAAITSVSIFPNTTSEIAGGSTATLYGIKRA